MAVLTDRDSAAKLGDLLRTSSVALYLELDADDRVAFANAHATQLFGRDPVGSRFTDLLVNFDRTAPGSFARVADEPRRINFMTFTDLPQTYVCHFVEGAGRVLVVGAVEPHSLELMQRSLLTVQRDFANQTRELQRTNSELSNTAKLRDTFFGMASHDLRTPLTTILASAEILHEELDPSISDDQRVSLRSIRLATELMLAVVDGFLAAALSSAGRLALFRTPTDLGAVAHDAVALLQRSAEQKGIRLIVELAPELPAVSVDRAKLVEVLVNLVRNAIEHSRLGDAITVVGRADESWITLEVRDQGAGIPPELRATLFEAYTRGANKTAQERSVGLGLALSKLVVDAHGGELAVSSTPSRGSIFSVRLPLR